MLLLLLLVASSGSPWLELRRRFVVEEGATMGSMGT
jgi:hypothetical protein